MFEPMTPPKILAPRQGVEILSQLCLRPAQSLGEESTRQKIDGLSAIQNVRMNFRVSQKSLSTVVGINTTFANEIRRQILSGQGHPKWDIFDIFDIGTWTEDNVYMLLILGSGTNESRFFDLAHFDAPIQSRDSTRFSIALCDDGGWFYSSIDTREDDIAFRIHDRIVLVLHPTNSAFRIIRAGWRVMFQGSPDRRYLQEHWSRQLHRSPESVDQGTILIMAEWTSQILSRSWPSVDQHFASSLITANTDGSCQLQVYAQDVVNLSFDMVQLYRYAG